MLADDACNVLCIANVLSRYIDVRVFPVSADSTAVHPVTGMANWDVGDSVFCVPGAFGYVRAEGTGTTKAGVRRG